MGITTKRKAALTALRERTPPAGTTSWRAAKSLLRLLSQVDSDWPTRKKASDGTVGDASHQTRDSDHNPWVKDGAVGVVTAIDITHDPAGGCDAESVVEALRSSRDRRINYIICNKRIVSATVSAWMWRPYAGSNPHTKHFHLSVSANKTLYDSQDDWEVISSA